MTYKESLNLLNKMQGSLLMGGGTTQISKQKSKGKMTARERIDFLVEKGTFIENKPYTVSRINDFGMDNKKVIGDGVIVGSAQINSQQVWITSQDFTVMGGSLGEEHAAKIVDAQMMALKTRKPFIQLNDSGGARIQEGILALEGYGAIFRANTLASGIIPQISLIMGPCAGGAVYSPAITDFVFMVDKTSHMYVTGPDVIKSVTGEEVSHEHLGGATTHNTISGNAHFLCQSEKECLNTLKKLLSLIPPSNTDLPPAGNSTDKPNRETPEILKIIPDQINKSYDIRQLIEAVFDYDTFLEVHKLYAVNIVIGLARLDNLTVGIIANQPKCMAGSLDSNSSDKAARFIRFCDSFGIPIISLVDVPGYLPGTTQEHGGIIRHGAKLLYAIAEATVPKISMILRKAYGGAYISMASHALGYDRVLALPIAEIAVMGPKGAANIIFKKEIDVAKDHDLVREIKTYEYQNKFMNPYVAAGHGIVDDVIDPKKMRIELIHSLSMIATKKEESLKKKHGNIPL